MAFNRQDLQDFDALVEANPKMGTEELRAVMVAGIERAELIETLKVTGNEIYYRFSNIIEQDIEEISKLGTPEAMLDFVIKKAFTIYTKEVADRKEQERIRAEEREQMEKDIEKAKEEEIKEESEEV